MVIVTHCVYETQLKLCFENLIVVKIALFYNYNYSHIFKVQFQIECVRQYITQYVPK